MRWPEQSELGHGSGQPVPRRKEKTVQTMFSAIAHRYDLNNSLLSLGWHHSWKRKAVQIAQMQEEMTALDLCTGTADIAILLARQARQDHKGSSQEGQAVVSPPQADFPPRGRGLVIALDLNERMLALGRKKIAGQGLNHQITCLRGHAEWLQFKDHSFDLVTVAFGVRNLDDIYRAFAEIHRVLKPEGRVICLEFSRPLSRWLRGLYDFYSFKLLPYIGTAVSGDKTGVYRYLPASIRHFPDQEGLKQILHTVGFRKVEYFNLTGGIVAIHVGWR